MKWLFLLMVLANAGYIAWQGFSAADASVVTKPVYGPPVSERIYLIDETRPDEASVAEVLPLTPAETMVNEVGQAVESMLQEQGQASTDLTNLLCPVVILERDADRREVISALNQHDLQFTQKDATGKRDKYWLYISAPATVAQAQDIVARLKLKRIDSYVIARGEMKNRISLGLFSSKVRAEQAQASISEQTGMSVNVYPHQRNVKLYELLLERPISAQAWENALQSLDLSKLLIKIEKNPC